MCSWVTDVDCFVRDSTHEQVMSSGTEQSLPVGVFTDHWIGVCLRLLRRSIHSTFKKMKNLKYVFVFVLGMVLVSCEDYVVEPRNVDDPVTIPPPPPPKP